MRLPAALAAALVLAGCGSATVERAGAPAIVPDRPSPPIAAVDEEPPDDVSSFLRDDFDQPSTSGVDVGGSVTALCFSSTTPTTCPTPTAEELAKVKEEQARFVRSIRPAAGAQPRVIAKLALAGGGEALFTAWHNASGRLCWEADEEVPGGGGGGGPSGPCTSAVRAGCDALCLESSGASTGADPTRYVLSGTVPTAASAIRVTTADGEVSTYALEGPVVDGDRRVFMLELGSSDWRTIELVRHGVVYDSETIPETTVASEECDAEVGPMPMPTPTGRSTERQAELDAYSRKLDACLKTKPGWSPAPIGLDTTPGP